MQDYRLISPNFGEGLKPNFEIRRFADGDAHVVVPNIDELKNKEAIIYHRLYPEQDRRLLELLLLLDIVRPFAARISLVIPYLPYARQHKAGQAGESISAKTVCRLLHSLGTSHITTIDCHFFNHVGILSFEGLTIENISAAPKLFALAQQQAGQPLLAIGPDAGSHYLVAPLGGWTLKKQRLSERTGEYADRLVSHIEVVGSVMGRHVVLLDDLVSTGGTLCKAIEVVRSAGAESVRVGVTHLLSDPLVLQTISGQSEAFLTTNTVPVDNHHITLRSLLENHKFGW